MNKPVDKMTPIAEYLARMIDVAKAGGVGQNEIAQIVGYNTPNMITMVKQGRSTVAPDKVLGFAKALHVDPKHLLRLWFKSYQPNNLIIIESILGGTAVTDNEMNIIQAIREASNDSNPYLDEDKEAGIRRLFSPID